MSIPPTNLQYRCRCGAEIAMSDGVETCPQCGFVIPTELDPTMTLSFCIPTPTSASTVPAGDDSAPSLTLPAIASDEDGSPTIDSPVGDVNDAETTDQRIGKRLGHFVLQEPLGAGGMGTVYRALDTSLQRYVAVKVLRRSGVTGDSRSDSGHTDRLRQEAVAQARLNHPRVVTIYYVGGDAEEPFLAMELLPGPTLKERIAEGPLGYDQLMAYALQVTDALHAADRRGLVHGDIKPSNLLIDGTGKIKLGDFGLSRRSDRKSGQQSVSGTPNYLAPELLDGATPNRRTDMYALGVTLFELAFGRRPFELSGNTLRQQLLTHKTAEIQFPSRWPNDLPEAFRDVLMRLLAKDPDDRFQTYDDLAEKLNSLTPVGSTLAGRSARAIAYLIDSVLLTIPGGVLMVPNTIIRIVNPDSATRWLNENQIPLNHSMAIWATGILAILGVVLTPLAALWWDLRRYRTPGRYLMQLRVVDRFGLSPSRRVLIIRNLIRYFPFWITVPLALPTVLGTAWSDFDNVIATVVTVVNGAFIFGPMRRTLHDRICNTHVVLDETVSKTGRQRVAPGSSIHYQ